MGQRRPAWVLPNTQLSLLNKTISCSKRGALRGEVFPLSANTSEVKTGRALTKRARRDAMLGRACGSWIRRQQVPRSECLPVRLAGNFTANDALL